MSKKNNQELKKSTIFYLALGELGKTMYSVIIINFLMFFFVPGESSSMPMLLPRAAFWYAIIRGTGVIVDAISDPFIASLSDKSKGKYGRRITFMRYSAIPSALLSFGIFMVPFRHESIVNVVWLAITVLAYYIFSTMYNVPYNALIPEVIRKPKQRVKFYTIAAYIQVAGALLAAFIPTIKKLLVNTMGFNNVTGWQITFLILAIIGGICAYIPTIKIKEKDYVEETTYHKPVFRSMVEIFKIKEMLALFGSSLISGTAGAFFRAALLYYITMLLGLEESFFTVIMLVSLATTFISYFIINKLLPFVGRKKLLVAGSVMFFSVYLLTYFSPSLTAFISPKLMGIAMGILFGYPTAAGDILFPAAYADLCHYDRITSKHSRAGIFLAGKNFVLKVRSSIVNLIIPLVITIGSTTGKATNYGVLTTALIAAVLSIIGLFILIRYYDDEHIIQTIKLSGEADGDKAC